MTQTAVNIDRLLESFIEDTEQGHEDQEWKADRRMAFLAGMIAGFKLLQMGKADVADGIAAINQAFEDVARAWRMQP